MMLVRVRKDTEVSISKLAAARLILTQRASHWFDQ